MASLIDTTSTDQTTTDGSVPTKSYQVIGTDKVLVSKHAGKVWKSRRDAALKKREKLGITEAWDQCINYFENDQLTHRGGGDGTAPGNRPRARQTDVFCETENVVFSNVVTATPLLFAKNPSVEITAADEALQPMITCSERLINAILVKKEVPGVNLKPKIRRAILSAFLTNLGWIEVGWVTRQPVDETVSQDSMELYTELEQATTAKDIQEIEGKIQALEMQTSILEEPGPFVKWHRPDNVIRDPNSVEEDLSDADWVMVRTYMKTEYLKAKYSTGGENPLSLYDPTHMIPVDDNASIEDEVNNFQLFAGSGKDTDWRTLGYPDEETFRDSCVTEVWTVWDKITRRVYLYHAKNWSFPIWAYTDPYKLTTFYPVRPLSFYTGMRGGESKGETTFYLDQQDGINFINSVRRQIMDWAALKAAYDTNAIKPDQVEKLFRLNQKEYIGLTPKEGQKLSDIMPTAIEHPAMRYLQLFDKQPYYAAVDRLASVSDVMKGAQFKTNTTNDAVAFYQESMQNRFDDLIDQVEDFVGDIAYLLLQLCWKNWEMPDVAAIIGPVEAQGWKPLLPEQISLMSVQVVGGSTQKPTGQAKKKEALEISQILGQFAKASPMAGILAIKVMERAFDTVTIKEEEWEMIYQSMGGGQLTPPPASPPVVPGQSNGYANGASLGLSPEVVQQGLNNVPPTRQ